MVFIIYAPITFIIIKASKQKELSISQFINETLVAEPIASLFMVLAHIGIFYIYGCFIYQIFLNRPIIELYEEKIRIYPVFGFKMHDIPVEKIVNIEYQEHSFLQKGIFAVRKAKKEDIKKIRKDTKVHHAALAAFKNSDFEIKHNLKKYEAIFKKQYENSKT